eukprot:gene12699-14001_t
MDAKRGGEKPTLLSRRVLRTNRVNVTEAAKLQDKLGRFQNIQKQREQTHKDHVMGLECNLRKISKVKDKMEVSVMRRKFLADHGVNLKVKDVNMDEFVSAFEDILGAKNNGRESIAATFAPPMQFRVISPPMKGRSVMEVYRDLEGEEKLVQKRIEKEKFQLRLKKKSEAWKDQSEAATKGGRKKVRKPGSASLSVGAKQRKAKNVFTNEERNKNKQQIINARNNNDDDDDYNNEQSQDEKEGQIVSEIELDNESNDKGVKKNNKDDEFVELMQKYLQRSEEKRQLSRSTKEESKVEREISSPTPSSSLLFRRTDRPRNEFSRLSSVDNYGSDEPDRKDGNVSSDLREWKNLVKKTKEDLKIREAKFRAQSPMLQGKDKPISRKNRQQPDSFSGQYSTAIASPSQDPAGVKSVMKGYATMQMTVGKRAISIYVPRFENEAVCKGQTAGRANVKSCFEVEQVREKREQHKGRSLSFDL